MKLLGRFTFAVAAAVAIVTACTPQQRAAAVQPISEAACVLIHGFAQSGHADTLCATAEELAPYVAELLAEREAAEPRAPVLAFAIAELPAPKKPSRAPARRRCASWVAVSSRDASIEGGRDASLE